MGVENGHTLWDARHVECQQLCKMFGICFVKIPKEEFSGNIINVFGGGLWITQGRCKEIIKATLVQQWRKETRFDMKRWWS